MVSKKLAPEDGALDTNIPPRLQDMRKELWSATDSDSGDDTRWESSQGKGENPVGGHPKSVPDDMPSSLKPGGAGYADMSQEEVRNVWDDERKPPTTISATHTGASLSDVPESLRPGPQQPRVETNPFLRKMSQNSSSGASQGPLEESLSKLNLGNASNNPWQPALDEKEVVLPSTLPDAVNQVPDQDPWASVSATQLPPAVSGSPALISLPSEGESPSWGEDVPAKPNKQPLSPVADISEELLEDQQAWDDVPHLDKGKGKAVNPLPAAAGMDDTLEDWNFVDPEPIMGSSPAPKDAGPTDISRGKAPERSPRRSEESGPPLPPRSGGPNTYHIKNVNWHDATTDKNPRTSPILVQNANGPCPLVALVNALILTTPAELTDTVLVQVLRSREQISLGLLLDAVFDELMSPRRTNPEVALPDITDLYAFLQSLHTGMNVNPRFVSPPALLENISGDAPGGFEDTREMKLYSTFKIPLLHGWLPPRDEPAHEAMCRRAESYEDAQNLLFMEEDLEATLSDPSSVALTVEEQELYQDILTIKSFLSISATQLTKWGLEVITRSMAPGSVAILFRNDHFSTLYKHPESSRLLVLVTDAGYASHAEVVWESLVDVNGERAEFFSGDFRPVGGPHDHHGATSNQQYAPGSSAEGSTDREWPSLDTAAARGWKSGHSRGHDTIEDEVPLSPNHEQEDHDLALALQLQEEEEQRHHAAQEKRRQEARLSEQYIEQQGRRPVPVTERRPTLPDNPSVPIQGRANRRVATNGRQNQLPVHRPGANSEDAPPSYEQAQHHKVFRPPVGHASHPGSPAVSRQSTGLGTPLRQRVTQTLTDKSREGSHKDCIVM